MPTEDITSTVSLLGLSPDMFNIPSMIASVIFGLIGFVAFNRARKNQQYKKLVISIVLMIYPIFVANAIATWLIGIALTAGLFIFKDE